MFFSISNFELWLLTEQVKDIIKSGDVERLNDKAESLRECWGDVIAEYVLTQAKKNA